MRFSLPRLIAAVLTFSLLSGEPANAAIRFNRVLVEDLELGSSGPQVITMANIDDDASEEILAVSIAGDIWLFDVDENGEVDDLGDTILDGVGSAPTAIVVEDFDADDSPDIAVTLGGENVVKIFFGDDGFYDPDESVSIPVNNAPLGLVAARLDRDQDFDIAVMNRNSVFFVRNDGTRTFASFTPSVASIPTDGELYQLVASRKIDNDGDTDLVVSAPDSSQIFLLLGNGDGTFAAADARNVGTQPSGLTVGDYTGDGFDDLLVVEQDDSDIFNRGYLFNSSDADVFPDPAVAFDFDGTSQTVVSFDLEGNGTLDAVVAPYIREGETAGLSAQVLCQESEYCTRFQGELEAGIFAPVIGVSGLSLPGGAISLDSGRLNNDALDDVVVFVRNDADEEILMVSTNTSTSGTPEPTTAGTSPTPTPPPTTVGTPATPTNTRTPTLIPTATPVPTLPLGACMVELDNGANSSQPVALANGDFNRDGDADLAVADFSNQSVLIVLSAGATAAGTQSGDCGSFRPARGGSGQLRNPIDLGSADFDRDGRLDIAGVSRSDGLAVFFGDGEGGIASRATAAGGPQPSSLAVADFNRDSKPDVIVSNSDVETVTIYLGTGDRSQPFGAGIPCSMPVGRRSSRVVTGDLNADGRDDFAITSANTNEMLVFFRSTTAFTCDSSAFQPQTERLTGTPRLLLAGTFDRANGVPDMVVGFGSDVAGDTGMFYSSAGDSGSVRYGSPLFLQDPSGGLQDSRALAAGDLNRDGRLDLVVADAVSSSTRITGYLAGTDGRLNVPQNSITQGTGSDPRDLAIGDFDDDGRADIAVANAGNGSIVYMISSRPPPTFTPTQTFTPSQTPTVTRTFTGTVTQTPTNTATPTRTRRQAPTDTPLPTETPRGVIRVGSCAVLPEGQSEPSMAWLLMGSALLVFARRRAPR